VRRPVPRSTDAGSRAGAAAVLAKHDDIEVAETSVLKRRGSATPHERHHGTIRADPGAGVRR